VVGWARAGGALAGVAMAGCARAEVAGRTRGWPWMAALTRPADRGGRPHTGRCSSRANVENTQTAMTAARAESGVVSTVSRDALRGPLAPSGQVVDPWGPEVAHRLSAPLGGELASGHEEGYWKRD